MLAPIFQASVEVLKQKGIPEGEAEKLVVKTVLSDLSPDYRRHCGCPACAIKCRVCAILQNKEVQQ